MFHVVDQGIGLWRCHTCPVLIPGGTRLASVDEHERRHEIAALARMGVPETDLGGNNDE